MTSPSDNPAPERLPDNEKSFTYGDTPLPDRGWEHPQPPADAPSPGAQCGECGGPLDDGHCVKCSGGLKKGWLAKDVAKATERVAEWRGEPGAQEALPLSEGLRRLASTFDPRMRRTDLLYQAADELDRLQAALEATERKLRAAMDVILEPSEPDAVRLHREKCDALDKLHETERKLREAEAQLEIEVSGLCDRLQDIECELANALAANATLQREKEEARTLLNTALVSVMNKETSLQAVESKLSETNARAERAEAALVAEPPECDPDCNEAHCPYTHSPVTWKDKAEDYRREIELLRESLDKADARITDLTAALAGAREEERRRCTEVIYARINDYMRRRAPGWEIVEHESLQCIAAIRALPSPTSEKAEGDHGNGQ